jgi:hypothetical protein
MDTGSLPGVKRIHHSGDHPPLSSAEVENGLELYLCHLSVLAQARLGVILNTVTEIGGWVGPQALIGEGKISCPCWEWNHNYSVIQPVAWSLY